MIHYSYSCSNWTKRTEWIVSFISCSSLFHQLQQQQERRTQAMATIITTLRHFSRSYGASPQNLGQTDGRTDGQTNNWHVQTSVELLCYCDVSDVLSWNRHESSRVESPTPCLSVRFPAAAAISVPSIKPETRLGMWVRGWATWRHAVRPAADAACANCRRHRVRLAITWTRRIIDSQSAVWDTHNDELHSHP